MAFPVLGQPIPQFVDSNGNPLNGGTLEIRDPVSGANKFTYPTATDADAGTNANTADISLNIRGEPEQQVWGVNDQEYKVTLKDSGGVTLWSATNIGWDLPIVYSSNVRVARTSAEQAAGVAEYASGNAAGDITSPQYEELDPRRYGGVGDGSTDDSVALQTVINVALHGGLCAAELPPGQWLHNSTLYYQYDVTNNAGAPSGNYQKGLFEWRGAGANQYFNWKNGQHVGSYLVYGGSTGDGHIILGSSAAYRARRVSFRDVSIIGNTTGRLVYSELASHLEFKNFLAVQQSSSGSGIECKDCFFVTLDKFFIQCSQFDLGTLPSSGSTTKGLWLYNVSAGSGIYVVGDGSTNGFGYGRIYGGHDSTSSGSYALMNCISEPSPVQSKDCVHGLHFGNGARNGVIVSPHMENSLNYGIEFTRNCDNITVLSPYLQGGGNTTGADILLGDPTNAFTTGHRNIRIVTPQHINTTVAAYEINASSEVDATSIVQPTLAADGSDTPIPFKVQDAVQRGLEIVRPRIGAGFSTAVVSDDGTNDLIHRVEAYVGGGSSGVELRNGAPLLGGSETLTVADTGGNVDLGVILTKLDSSGGAFSITVPDGTMEGQRKTLLMTAAGSNATVTVTSKHPDITALTTTFNAVNERLTMEWVNGKWALVSQNGL